jgi:alanine-glyoxylate transaminase/serine-glyoxylate transaminase/serine-pyruvate transaminase
MVETGHFATLWRNLAVELGLEVDFLPGDWRHGVDATIIEKKLTEDEKGAIRAVAIVHNETSTGAVSRVHEIRKYDFLPCVHRLSP